MDIGVISDIHRRLPQAALDAFAGCTHIICAGDVQDARLLWELEAVAPVIAVRGNCDTGAEWNHLARLSAHPTLGGVHFFVVHRPEDIGVPAPEVQVVIHGHTHVPRNQVIDGVRYLNPGSASAPRHGSHASVLRLTVADGALQAIRFIDLD